MNDEIEKLKEEIKELETESSDNKELKNLKRKHKKLQFRKKHRKLLNVTEGLEQGAKRMFGGLFSGMKKVGVALEKSDAYIAKAQAKKRALAQKSKKKVVKKKPKKDITDASDLLVGVEDFF